MTESTEETTANSTWSRMLAGNRRFAEGKAEHPWQDKEAVRASSVCRLAIRLAAW